jgi:hypothetical protein
MNHKVWSERMRNKNGTIKQRADWKLAEALEKEGLILLVPSVTEVAKVSDGFSAFSNGAKWGRDMTVEAYRLLVPGGDYPTYPTPEQLEKAARTAMDAPKEAGSELHDLFHRIRTGEEKTPTEDQVRFHDICAFEVQRFGIGEFQTEVQFADASLGYGGTCDLTAGDAGMDWKTVSKEDRETRTSEILQMGAYGRRFGWKRARVVYILQNPLKVVRVEDFDQARLDAGYEAFTVALKLSRMIEGLA